MCFSLFIHNTSYAHESRWVSIINPQTGWAVYSPFQDPYCRACPTPCLGGYVAPRDRCPWHRGCCRLERFALSCAPCQPQNHPPFAARCPRPPVRLHLHGGAESARALADPAFLDGLLACDPVFLAAQSQLFHAGAELALAAARRRACARRLEEVRSRLRGAGVGLGLHMHIGYATLLSDPDPSLSLSPSPLSRAAVPALVREAEALERSVAHMTRVMSLAQRWIGELARFWDARPDFAPRPGREADPRANARNREDGFLRPCYGGAELGRRCRVDPGPVPFPRGAPTPAPGFESIVLANAAGMNVIPWAATMPVVGGNTILPG